ncbi:MAG: hypothetical protein KC441_18195 [Anaerolineales bacterium]|nr:hypothetical protein [Anaerolineales bacterium]
MFARRVIDLFSRLIFSRWPPNYKEYHSACEDMLVARLGPLHLEVNRCFVLDHDDASVHVRIPKPWGQLHVGYVICLGADQIRKSGLTSITGRTTPDKRETAVYSTWESAIQTD